MPSTEVLNSHTLADLRKEVTKSNKMLGLIPSYSKGMTKPKLIELMLKHKKRFHHIKMKEPRKKKEQIRKKASAQEIKDSLMIPGKYSTSDIKTGKALIKNQPKKEKKEPKEPKKEKKEPKEPKKAKKEPKEPKKAKKEPKEEVKPKKEGKRTASNWALYVKKMGGVKAAKAAKDGKDGYLAFKKSLK
tara:strand:- start:1293 stop:1856 length:564 start_codon:yes stop_codon:yes gene_type:complete